MTIRLYNKDTNALIGAIAEADFKVLTDALEEESETDNDYFIDQATIDVIAEAGASDHLLNLLRNAVGSTDGVEIRWERQSVTQ
jgi:hypothetical protein